MRDGCNRRHCSIMMAGLAFGLAAAAGRVSADPLNQPPLVMETPFAPTRDSGKLDLRLRLEAGSGYLITVVSRTKLTQLMATIPGATAQKMNMNTTSRTTLTYQVKEVDADGTAAIDTTYRSMAMTFEMSMGKQRSRQSFDTEHQPQALPLQFKPLASIVGKTISVRMDAHGKVLEIRGFDAIFKHLGEGAPAQVREMQQKMFKSMFNEASVKQMMQQATGSLPDHPVGIGDSWTQKLTLNTGFPVTVTDRRTLDSRSDGIATVKNHGVIGMGKDGPPLTMGPMKMRMELSGEMHGTSKINELTGMPVKDFQQLRFSGTISMKPPGATADIKIPLFMKGTTQVTWQPLAPEPPGRVRD